MGGELKLIGDVGDSAVEGGDEEGSRWGGGCDVRAWEGESGDGGGGRVEVVRERGFEYTGKGAACA